MEKNRLLMIKVQTEISSMMYEISSKVSHQHSIVKGLEAELEFLERQLKVLEDLVKNAQTDEDKLKYEEQFNALYNKVGMLKSKQMDAVASLVLLEDEKTKEYNRCSSLVLNKYKQDLEEQENM